MNIKSLIPLISVTLLTACQVVSPIFVDYNGVRMDVAQWINQNQHLSMQQKRSMAQLSRAQQQLSHIDNIPEIQKLVIAKENTIAMQCAQRHLTDLQINKLQQHIFGEDTQKIIDIYDQTFPKLKLDVQAIQCD